jgi:hypothetical protein
VRDSVSREKFPETKDNKQTFVEVDSRASSKAGSV